MNTVSVLIAAHNCAQTLGRAIASALDQPETREVIVVDDASEDDTRACAADWETRDRRVQLVALDTNAGPAGARNRAIDVATGDLLALLDSDDFFLPGRLSRLLSQPDCDMIADNIVFVTETSAETLDFAKLPEAGQGFEPVDAHRFIRGNLASAHHARGELGFLKPLLSRRFLQHHQLRYDETLRLGEDYDLYVRMLLAGARFRVTRQPGYGAVVRPGSLSARHSTADLAALENAITQHERQAEGEPSIMSAMRAYRAEVRARLDHRVFLDRKASAGMAAAMRYARAEKGRLAPIIRGIARDKLRPLRRDRDQISDDGYRLLLALDL